MFKHHYLIVLLALSIFAACGKDSEFLESTIHDTQNYKLNPKIPSPGGAPCNYKESFLNGNLNIGYYGAHLVHYFQPDESVKYTIYSYWDSTSYTWLEQYGTSRADRWQMWLGDIHNFVILESQIRCIEIDIRNRLPLPYQIHIQSSCKNPVKDRPRRELKAYQ